ncbi:MAG: crosslink repair DNA glycosylase YcaQ family protein, partial [Pseudomonadota bacterium]
MTALPRLDNARARALFLHRHGLAEPPSGPGRGEDLRGVIGDLGFVQLDSISTVARAHHMILHARRTAYRPGALHRLHDRERAVFEHWTHDASMIDMRWFPHWRHRFRRDAAELDARWSGRDFRPRLDAVLRRIADEGPCAVGDLEDETPRGPGVWWNWTPTKAALEYLWRAGHLSVARREAFRKVYDLTENVIPAQHLNAARSEDETLHWACNAALDRLGFATSGELAAFWDLVSPADAKAWTAEALARGEIVEAEIEQADRRLRRVVLRPETL